MLTLVMQGLVCLTAAGSGCYEAQEHCSFEVEFSGFLRLPYSSLPQVLTEGCQGGSPGTEHAVAVPRPPEHL